MVYFFDDTDLSEYERDQAHRILYYRIQQTTCEAVAAADKKLFYRFPEYPFENEPQFPCEKDAITSPASGEALSVASGHGASSTENLDSSPPPPHDAADAADAADDSSSLTTVKPSVSAAAAHEAPLPAFLPSAPLSFGAACADAQQSTSCQPSDPYQSVVRVPFPNVYAYPPMSPTVPFMNRVGISPWPGYIGFPGFPYPVDYAKLMHFLNSPYAAQLIRPNVVPPPPPPAQSSRQRAAADDAATDSLRSEYVCSSSSLESVFLMNHSRLDSSEQQLRSDSPDPSTRPTTHFVQVNQVDGASATSRLASTADDYSLDSTATAVAASSSLPRSNCDTLTPASPTFSFGFFDSPQPAADDDDGAVNFGGGGGGDDLVDAAEEEEVVMVEPTSPPPEDDVDYPTSPTPVAELQGAVADAPPFEGESDAAVEPSDDAERADDSPPPAEPKTAAKSWASLFSNANAVVVSAEEKQQSLIDAGLLNAPTVSATAAAATGVCASADDDRVVVPAECDPTRDLLRQRLTNVHLEHRGWGYQPRGLRNFGNWCYVNAVLQALLACPPFFNLLSKFADIVERNPTCTPVLDALAKLVAEMSGESSAGRGRRVAANIHDYSAARPLEPKFLCRIVSNLNADVFNKGHQEDAEEFLLALLNSLHEEIANIVNDDARESDSPVASAPDDEWKQVGPGRKLAVTRQAKLEDSIVARIFAGRIRYTLQRQGSKESSNVEPFFTLPLEIQASEVRDVQSALAHSFRREALSGVTSNRTEVEASRRGALQELPAVLILQLKYFLFGADGVKKLNKRIEYRLELNMDQKTMAPVQGGGQRSAIQRKYKLFAVVLHEGERTEGGHYTALVFHAGRWVEMDDTRVTPVDTERATRPRAGQAPYLLFYRRCDLMQQGAP